MSHPVVAALTAVVTALMNAPASAQSDRIAALVERQTQQMMDAVAVGDRSPWARYLDDKVVYVAEDGSTKSKAQLLDEIRPLPKGITGTLRVTRFTVTLHGATAVATYVAEEDEGYFGQNLHARYLSTDTWIDTPQGWRVAAVHVSALRADPPAMALRAEKLDEYTGIYALTPDVTYTIRRVGNELAGQRTGRKPEALKVELPDCLFVPGQPRIRKIVQRDAAGRVTGFVDRRETWDIVWRRVR
jgi:hypothetical protein